MNSAAYKMGHDDRKAGRPAMVINQRGRSVYPMIPEIADAAMRATVQAQLRLAGSWTTADREAYVAGWKSAR